MTDPIQRFITPEGCKELFGLQVQLLPELLGEVHLLSKGSPGLVVAIVERMGDSISEDPDIDVTPTRIREVLGAPEDESALPEWRETFIQVLQQEQEARAN